LIAFALHFVNGRVKLPADKELPMAAAQLYGDDLADIHNVGYGFHWRSAAPQVLEWLRRAGIASGTVVDLGCGGGQWLARLAEEGYDGVGVDSSPAMLRTAKKNAPDAEFILGSFEEVDLSPCDAVTSLGEPLNYLASARGFQRALKSAHAALRPRGLFIFDVREPSTAPVEPRVATRVGLDWACISVIEESMATQRLVRHITAFRRRGAAYRRTDERHELQLYSKETISGWLRKLGFHVRTYRRYGNYALSPRQLVFVARK
jgi:SAM-dependent methyltransferase